MTSTAPNPRPLAGLSTRPGVSTELIGRWDDPNPSTQLQPLDLAIQARDIIREQRATDLSAAPVFNHRLEAALKNADAWRYNNRTEDDKTPEEQRAFTSVPYKLPFVGIGEDVNFDASGQNIILNGNYDEKQIRFGGNLYNAALDDRYEAVGTNEITFAGRGTVSTKFDKVIPRPAPINLDSSLLISSQPGYASLRNDFMRPCPEAPGIDINEPLSIGQYNDVTLRNDEVLDDPRPRDRLPALGNKLSVAAAISRSFKR